jgi:chloramphenicol 3-O phosphotransferase
VIVLNGGSSSGKSGIVRCLQAVLPDPWLAAAVDSLIEAMPASMQSSDAGIEFAADGGVNVGSEFRELEAAWMVGVAAMARAGARVIVDDVFLSGATSQERWQQAFGGLDVQPRTSSPSTARGLSPPMSPRLIRQRLRTNCQT